MSWPLQTVSWLGGRGEGGGIASSADDNCHLHNLMAIYDICFSLASGRNAVQAAIFVETCGTEVQTAVKSLETKIFFSLKQKSNGQACITVLCLLIFSTLF